MSRNFFVVLTYNVIAFKKLEFHLTYSIYNLVDIRQKTNGSV